MNLRSNLDSSLKELHQVLLAMGKRVEKAIHECIATLQSQDLEMARHIVSDDQELNKLEEQVLELGAKIIATQQPIGKDMRRIIIAFRIASDLERMGDLAVDIAKVTLRIGDQELIKPLIDIPRLGEMCQQMAVESMQSYIDENVDLAYKMSKMDDEVDHLYSQVLHDLFAYMIENPKNITQAMLLSFVGRYLERMADHATNIGESVVYLVQGKRPDLN